MIAKKINIDITGITLLSVDEYSKYRNRIPQRLWWWLRTNATDNDIAVAVVNSSGEVKYDDAGCEKIHVRPALIYNSKTSDLRTRDKITLADLEWTVISDKYALCDDSIAKMPFRDWECWNEPPKDTNAYEASDVKVYLENWARTVSIISEEKGL